jgi:hypothetical protein
MVDKLAVFFFFTQSFFSSEKPPKNLKIAVAVFISGDQGFGFGSRRAK